MVATYYPLCSLLLFFFLPADSVAILQNVTVSSAVAGLQFLPPNAWTVSTDSRATGGSFAHASAENATVMFTITSPSTVLFWHGFMPQTAARYSICIDCANVEALGSIVTIDSQAGTQNARPIILFASKPLANTTHSIVVRNLRNPIEGVVGEVSLDSFSFTTDVEAPPPASTPTPTGVGSNPSAGEIAGIVFASVVAAGILLALAKCFTTRRRQAAGPPSGRRPKIWRKSVLTSGLVWKRHRRTTSSESSPIIEAVWKSKALTGTGPGELPTHNPPAMTLHPDDNNQRRSVVPAITITSPSTPSTVPSQYSSNHQETPAPFKLSIYATDRGVRQSDPYASYAAAYAAFAGMIQPEEGEDAHEVDASSRKRRQQSALRDSSLLPPTQMQERTLQAGTVPMPPMPRNAPPMPPMPPSSFRGRGIRDGQKGTRTLSDKIKRGTLPMPPQLEEGVLYVSGDLTVVHPERKGYTVKGDIKIAAREEPEDQRPSMIPTLSSSSSDKSSIPPGANATPNSSLDDTQPPPEQASLPQRTATEPAFWSSYGDFSIFETVDGLEQVADSSSDGVESIDVEGSQGAARRQSLQVESPSSPSPKVTVHRPSQSEGGSIKPQLYQFNSNMSVMTHETSNTHTHTNRSSFFSITPSVSEFPMPPFKRASGTLNSAGTRTSGTTTSTGTFTDLLVSTPSSSSALSVSASGFRNHIVKEKVPPSAFATAVHGRPRRSKAPSLRVALDGSSIARSAQTGAGQAMVLATQTNGLTPIRRTSSRSSRSSKRRSQSSSTRMLPIGGDSLAPPLPNMRSKRMFEKSAEQSELQIRSRMRYGDADDVTDVPLYMRMLPETPQGSTNHASFNPTEEQPPRNQSRLTMASMMTTTDEEYAGDVQLFVASRRSIPPDLPRPITFAPSTAVSLRSEPAGSGSAGSSDGQWEMMVSNDKPAQAQGAPTGLSISTDRSMYRAANVPVSARTDMFEVGASEVSHATGARREPSYGLGSGMGMPWSPSFDWPASPSFNMTSPPVTAPMTTQRSFRSDMSKTNDYPTSISGSTAEGRNSNQFFPDSRPVSQGTMASGESPAWRDIIGTGGNTSTGGPKRSASRTRDSTYSTTSTFFGGVRSAHSSTIIPPVPPMPSPAPAATRDSVKPTFSINTRQGWHARSSSSQSPVDKPRPQRQRQTGHTAVGGVNSIFATPQGTATKPKLSLQRLENYTASMGNSDPTSRYYSPYTAHTSPPSSAELLISKR